MRILAFGGDIWHPAEVAQAGLSGLQQFGFTFDWIENANDFKSEMLSNYPMVILTKSNNTSSTQEEPWMTDKVQEELLSYVMNGNGLLALHSGTAGYENTQTLRRLMGGVFREHPDQCLVNIEPQPNHPLTEGVEAFTLKDEHYFMEFEDDQAEVFVKTISEHGVQPGGWLRNEGKGRVCVLTPGHNLDIWQHPSYQKLLLNSLTWCSQAQPI